MKKISSDWKMKPTSIDEMDGENSITHIVFFDENGDSNMKHIIKSEKEGKDVLENDKYFQLTGVIFHKNNLENTYKDMNLLKFKYWPDDGLYNYKKYGKQKVCFHSREIRMKEGPFSINAINYKEFMVDLSYYMSQLETKIFSSFINKDLHFKYYKTNAQSPYDLSLTFILERIVGRFLKDTDQLIIILESRGKYEDKLIHSKILELLNFGTYFVSYRQFSIVKGVYFNTKRTKNGDKTYYGLEIADLCSYPIYKYCKNHIKDKSFLLIETKIYGYPNYQGKGVKRFP